MGKYKVLHSARLDRELSKFDNHFQKQVDRIEDQLVENPYVGKSLGVEWFREKKIEKHRIYYVIYEDLKVVCMVAISEKKDQQKVINTVRLLLDFIREEVESLLDDGFI